jgi:hypothetical protein
VLLFAKEGDVGYEDLGNRLNSSEWPQAVVFWLRNGGGVLKKDPRDTKSIISVPLHSTFVQLRAMLLSFALTAVQCNIGMVFGPLINRLFDRTNIFSTQDYPYPIFPKLNLGHLNPTFTYYALPFIGEAFVTSATDGNLGTGHNVATDWASSANVASKLTRQWCKWDLGPLPTTELITKNYNLDLSSTFTMRAFNQPTVFGYGTQCQEVNLDRVSMSKVHQSVQTTNIHDARQHWFAYQNQWYPAEQTSLVAASLLVHLDCLL